MELMKQSSRVYWQQNEKLAVRSNAYLQAFTTLLPSTAQRQYLLIMKSDRHLVTISHHLGILCDLSIWVALCS